MDAQHVEGCVPLNTVCTPGADRRLCACAWLLSLHCCRYFASQGFYVVLDHQSLKGGPQDNIYDKDSFVASWVNLVKDMVADAPETNGKLLIDFINEPDG